MVCRAAEVAKYIINKSQCEKKPVTNLTLQKILYYIQAYALAETDEAAFIDDIVAWRYGPVVPNVYYQYNGNGSRPIDEIVDTPVLDSRCKKIADHIYELTKNIDIWRLVEKTHQDDPWKDTRQSSIISPNCIASFYKGKNLDEYIGE